jgi:hypothetical protein
MIHRLVASLAARAAELPEADKIVTDRPDFVESSNVVGKGCFQRETSAERERNKADGLRERGFSTPTLVLHRYRRDSGIAHRNGRPPDQSQR